MQTTIKFPAFSFRKIENPFERKLSYRNFVAVVEAQNLPDLTGWRKINVRDPKLTGSLPKEIRESFLGNLETFVFLNRGIVLAVDSASFSNENGVVSITLTDKDLHGLLDGGHTYEIIQQNRDQLDKKEEKQ